MAHARQRPLGAGAERYRLMGCRLIAVSGEGLGSHQYALYCAPDQHSGAVAGLELGPFLVEAIGAFGRRFTWRDWASW
jgi:hypothetical protein